jgi:hypothetical protein
MIKCSQTSGIFHSRYLGYINQLLLLDWAGPLPITQDGYAFVLLMVDGFSGYLHTIPYTHKSGENVVDGILTWISLFGCPDMWCTDNDSVFISTICTQLRTVLGIRSEDVPTYSPTSQGAVERQVRILKEGIQLLCNDSIDSHVSWTTYLKAIQWNANTTIRYHAHSPFQLMFGRDPVDPLRANYGVVASRSLQFEDYDVYIADLKSKLQTIHSYWLSKSQEIKTTTIDRQCPPSSITVKPDDVCFRISIVSGRRVFLGKVRVLRQCGSNTFACLDENNAEILAHGYQLIPIPPHEHRSMIQLDTPVSDLSVQTPTTSPDRTFYTIDKVIAYHPNRGYLVSWVDFDDSYNSWQRAMDMPPGCKAAMRRARNAYTRARSDSTGEH